MMMMMIMNDNDDDDGVDDVTNQVQLDRDKSALSKLL